MQRGAVAKFGTAAGLPCCAVLVHLNRYSCFPHDLLVARTQQLVGDAFCRVLRCSGENWDCRAVQFSFTSTRIRVSVTICFWSAHCKLLVMIFCSVLQWSDLRNAPGFYVVQFSFHSTSRTGTFALMTIGVCLRRRVMDLRPA